MKIFVAVFLVCSFTIFPYHKNKNEVYKDYGYDYISTLPGSSLISLAKELLK